MDWDLGAEGVGLLAAMSVAFGLASQVVAGRGTTRWMWSIGAGSFFVVGLLISEAWFGRLWQRWAQTDVSLDAYA
jgi:hypothetical protein